MERTSRSYKAALFLFACVMIAAVVGGIYYYTYHPIPVVDNRLWVKAGYTDANGNFVQTGTFQQTRPDKYDRMGLARVKEYAPRIADPDAPEASLIISSLDGNKACLLMRDGPNVVVREHIELAPPAQANLVHGRKVRKLFKDLGIKETLDDIHEYNGVQDAMEDLEYPIGHDPATVATIIERLLREVYGITEREGLEFTFEKTRPAAQKGASTFIFEGRR